METLAKQNCLTTVFLVRDSQRGSRQSLENLFARYLPRVRQMVERRLGWLRRCVEAEDIVQDAMLKAFKALGRFEHRANGSFGNWRAQRSRRPGAGQPWRRPGPRPGRLP